MILIYLLISCFFFFQKKGIFNYMLVVFSSGVIKDNLSHNLLYSCSSKCDAGPSSSPIAWELIRNTDSQVPPQTKGIIMDILNQIPGKFICIANFEEHYSRTVNTWVS